MATDDAPLLRIEVPAASEYLRTIRAIVRAFCRDVGADDDISVRALLVAVTEVATNAIGALERAGRDDPLVIECSTADGDPVIEIVDRAGGFDAAALAAVSRGERVDSATGLGLGLRLTRALVADLAIVSEREGSRITVRLARDLTG